MFEFGESGYHEYRATQSGGSGNNGGGEWISAILCIIGSCVGFWIVLFIGCYLWHSYN